MGKEIKKLAGKTNRTILKVWSLVLMAALGVLGSLSGCKPVDDIVAEYGVYPMYGVQWVGDPIPAYGVPATKYPALMQDEVSE